MGAMSFHKLNLPHVVIIGGGFGGLEAAKALRRAPVRVTLLDRQNHHLFQPLLYQVATAGLSPADIARPLRVILRGQRNLVIILGEARAIDLAKRVVHTDGEPLDYDYLILATGARHGYFGHQEWEPLAPGLKSLEDALEIRKRILTAFEVAERTNDAAERKAALTFIVVGGGPTGVEMAGTIAEIARFTLAQDFQHIDPTLARVILLDAGPRILPAYPEALSESARQQLKQLGVDVRCGAAVENLTASGVVLKGGALIAGRAVVWAAGNAASPLARSLGVPLDKIGRVIVQPDLTVAGHPEVFAIGDVAHCAPDGATPLPGISPVAMQQGQHAAANIRAVLAAGEPRPFRYVNRGMMATIGRHRAVAVIGRLQFAGFAAWFAWLFVHLLFLVGFRNRMMVLLEWGYLYLTYGRGARLITGQPWRPAMPVAPAVAAPPAAAAGPTAALPAAPSRS